MGERHKVGHIEYNHHRRLIVFLLELEQTGRGFRTKHPKLYGVPLSASFLYGGKGHPSRHQIYAGYPQAYPLLCTVTRGGCTQATIRLTHYLVQFL